MIEIVAYNPNWPEAFEAIASVVKSGLGSLALRVDHIGSTSVPGLAAKDIIDVQVTVSRFDDALTQAFQALGYTLHAPISRDHQPPGYTGPESEWEKRYFQPPAGQRPTHMHVRIAGRANQRYPLLFRDYLRVHPASASAYAALKRELASYHGEDRIAYTIIKDPVCDIIMASAEEWALNTGWSVEKA
jgi:GrpB-like predicted nucleotidyltransferase (UPF0157 family)